MPVTRRRFLSGTALSMAAAPFADLVRPEDLFAAQPATRLDGAFRHGVASGDPRADRVLLWTRVSGGTGEVPVRWTLASNPTLTRVVAQGETRTGLARDFTVKVDIAGLSPATTYYYRFEALGGRSVVGRTRTLPVGGAQRLRVALASCSNYPHGYFNAYGRIAERTDVDVVLHLGDYIYEYQQGRYADPELTSSRAVDPPTEITALDDYRRRYALYRTDPDLQEVHRQHPFIAVWDDHEVANNTWKDGAENHQPDEGDFHLRRDAAYQAYLEWLPVRETGSARQPLIYRSFAIGDLADLVMLDTRIIGRDEQVDRANVSAVEDPARSILGPAQEHWLDGELRESMRAGTRWQILGQQVMFAPQTPTGAPAGNPDSWDGYRMGRSRVYDMVERHGVPNLVVLTGDVHSSWAYDLPRQISDAYDAASGRGSLGVEIVCPAISSPSPFQGPQGEARLAETPKTRPHLKFLDGRSRGYVVMDITRDRLQADWWFVPTVKERATGQRFAKGLVCEAGSRHLVEATAPMTPATGADPAPDA
ncbi:MAG: alkaline phosphatase D family protein [Acidobacteriota bacterium]|nr:alkaline phosphatase D family protein [Acidobacteriota bacterium]